PTAAIEDGDVDPVARQRLGEWPDRRDADAATHEQRLRAPAGGRWEQAERTLADDRRAPAQLREPGGVIADVLRREAKVRRAGTRGQRKGMRLVPPSPVEESPEEELAGLEGHRRDVASGHVDRDRLVRFTLHPFD